MQQCLTVQGHNDGFNPAIIESVALIEVSSTLVVLRQVHYLPLLDCTVGKIKVVLMVPNISAPPSIMIQIVGVVVRTRCCLAEVNQLRRRPNITVNWQNVLLLLKVMAKESSQPILRYRLVTDFRRLLLVQLFLAAHRLVVYFSTVPFHVMLLSACVRLFHAFFLQFQFYAPLAS